jgi:hypothetical protein
MGMPGPMGRSVVAATAPRRKSFWAEALPRLLHAFRGTGTHEVARWRTAAYDPAVAG